ncbi:MAG: DNA polymerase IV [Polyangia bacterium]
MILHVDLDAFYASVEQRDNPALRGKPVLVGAPTGRSVVSAASYEARKFGCRSAMPMSEARRRCPQAAVVMPRMAAYVEESRHFRAILDRYSPLVEPLSIDEAFLDVTASEQLFGSAREIGERIRAETRAEMQLTCSVGIAPVKFAAKIASDVKKPDGLFEVTAEGLAAFLAPLPIERLFGVGPKTAARLRGIGLATLGDVAAYPPAALRARIGEEGASLQLLARGIDARRVVPDREAKSIGAEDTFERDLPLGPDLRREVMAQADRVAERLRDSALVATTVVLKIKDPQFQSRSRRRTLDAATSDGRIFAKVALELLDEIGIGPDGVRLSGVAAAGLGDAEAPRQLVLEARPARGDKLMDALDAIRGRFGRAAIARAELLDEDARHARRESRRGESFGPERKKE